MMNGLFLRINNLKFNLTKKPEAVEPQVFKFLI